MTSTKKRLLILELVAARQMPLDEARRRRTEILRDPDVGGYCCGSSAPSEL